MSLYSSSIVPADSVRKPKDAPRTPADEKAEVRSRKSMEFVRHRDRRIIQELREQVQALEKELDASRKGNLQKHATIQDLEARLDLYRKTYGPLFSPPPRAHGTVDHVGIPRPQPAAHRA